jgi:hypothetical protein
VTNRKAWLIIFGSLLAGIGLGIALSYHISHNMRQGAACIWLGAAVNIGALDDAALEGAAAKLATSNRFDEAEKNLVGGSSACARGLATEIAKMGAK